MSDEIMLQYTIFLTYSVGKSELVILSSRLFSSISHFLEKPSFRYSTVPAVVPIFFHFTISINDRIRRLSDFTYTDLFQSINKVPRYSCPSSVLNVIRYKVPGVPEKGIMAIPKSEDTFPLNCVPAFKSSI